LDSLGVDMADIDIVDIVAGSGQYARLEFEEDSHCML